MYPILIANKNKERKYVHSFSLEAGGRVGKKYPIFTASEAAPEPLECSPRPAWTSQ
jgi:hypothetical protein